MNFISSEGMGEERVMIKQMKSLKNVLNHVLIDIKLNWKHQ